MYAPSTPDPTVLVLQKLEVTQFTTAQEVVQLLLGQLDRGGETPDRYCLSLREGDQSEKRVADDCRPLLMQARWEEKHLKLVLHQLSAKA